MLNILGNIRTETDDDGYLKDMYEPIRAKYGLLHASKITLNIATESDRTFNNMKITITVPNGKSIECSYDGNYRYEYCDYGFDFAFNHRNNYINDPNYRVYYDNDNYNALIGSCWYHKYGLSYPYEGYENTKEYIDYKRRYKKFIESNTWLTKEQYTSFCSDLEDMMTDILNQYVFEKYADPPMPSFDSDDYNIEHTVITYTDGSYDKMPYYVCILAIGIASYMAFF